MTGTSWSLLVALDTFEKVSFQGVEIEDLLAGRPRWGGSRGDGEELVSPLAGHGRSGRGDMA